MVILGGWAFVYERGTPTPRSSPLQQPPATRSELQGYLAHEKHLPLTGWPLTGEAVEAGRRALISALETSPFFRAGA